MLLKQIFKRQKKSYEIYKIIIKNIPNINLYEFIADDYKEKVELSFDTNKPFVHINIIRKWPKTLIELIKDYPEAQNYFKELKQIF